MEFLVNIDIAVPSGMGSRTLAELRAAEAVRAGELVREGALRRLWRVPGRWANWGLWRAADEAALAAALDSLPLRPYMTIRIHSLEAHPNDPGTEEVTRSTAR